MMRPFHWRRAGSTVWVLILAIGLWSGGVWATESAIDILRRADEARGNLEGVTWVVTLEAVQKTDTETMTYNVSARRFDILAESLAPPKYKGNKILMIQGNMWFHKPNLSKPVPISRRQKLLGNAAYGDIATTNYAEDYTPTALPDEAIAGEQCYVFDLKAKHKKTTYAQIKYWVSKIRLVGVKAEYFTVSGKKFKTASMVYDNLVTINDGEPPFISRMDIQDALISHNITTLTFQHTRFQKLPDHIFDLNFLVR